MKILNLKIKNKNGQIIRDIDFAEDGITFIYGDIQEPKNLGATINSLGKTLLIKFIDYIYGANEDKSIVKELLNGYVLHAIILKEGVTHNIIRTLGNSDEIFINNEPKTLTEYKKYFNIKRSRIGKQLLVNKKVSNISYRRNPNKDDVIDFIYLIGLINVIESLEKIYAAQDAMKVYKQNKKELVKFYGDFDIKEIDEEIYFIDKEVERLTNEVDEISTKIKNIEISNIQINVVEEFALKSTQLKNASSNYEKLKLEKERINDFIEKSNKVDITSEHILKIYEKTKLEVPELLKKKINDVEKFHNKVFEERKEFLNIKQTDIQSQLIKMKKNICTLAKEVDSLGNIISINEVYEESIILYDKYNKNLQELKYKEGKLSQIKNMDEKIEIEDSNLTNEFKTVSNIIKEYTDIIEKYRDFIYDITRAIYDAGVNSYFDIRIRKKHQTSRPVVIDFTLKGDTGEGVSEVKKNLIDYLIFKYSKSTKFLIQDSACYNGIDPRQVTGMLEEVNKIANQSKKQAIIAINKYQLGGYEQIIKFVKVNSGIILSENDKLLKFDFD
jgi:uncharacterized protein YydD (DUF2326 family)